MREDVRARTFREAFQVDQNVDLRVRNGACDLDIRSIFAGDELVELIDQTFADV